MRKKPHRPGKAPPAQVTGGSPGDAAFLRIAAELGRLVGQFLAEETMKRTDRPSGKRPASKKK
jgi:hypothetical protein